MTAEEAQKAALRSLHGFELEVFLKLMEEALSLGNNSWKATERYRDLAKRCSPGPAKPLSTKTIQRAIAGLRRKGWITQPHPLPSRQTPTTFILTIPEEHYAVPLGPGRPPAIESLSAENRELFLMMKKRIKADELAEIEEEALDWLAQRGKYNATTHRDKIDELILKRVFGCLRAEECAPAFAHIYE